jgi:hypothetical protein
MKRELLVGTLFIIFGLNACKNDAREFGTNPKKRENSFSMAFARTGNNGLIVCCYNDNSETIEKISKQTIAGFRQWKARNQLIVL